MPFLLQADERQSPREALLLIAADAEAIAISACPDAFHMPRHAGYEPDSAFVAEAFEVPRSAFADVSSFFGSFLRRPFPGKFFLQFQSLKFGREVLCGARRAARFSVQRALGRLKALCQYALARPLAQQRPLLKGVPSE